ncbi:MAG: nucleotidyltransferase domain-containing protein [Burkholderiales bacterium]|uniref:nucleotidyltransferase domain-containing protein n=1 Tax=Limnobacter sp. TaxID=2003368 RepID=UPI00395175E8|nr:nucleotidyltransferase domain-containing protein [Burkholderiales bacterium]
MNLRYGLADQVIDQIQAVFARYPDIQIVYLFGSRAAGNFRDGSDIDLAVVAPSMPQSTFNALWNEIDALPLVFKVDCIQFEQLENEALKHNILEKGVRFYPV